MSGNKIILVTGEPRSGTSLNMLMLSKLGVPIAGEQFPFLRGKNEEDMTDEELARYNRLKNLNKLGFYEIPGIVARGIPGDVPDELNNKAVKIITSGAYPITQGEHVIGTSTDKYDKAILCLRNPRAISKSQQGLEQSADGSSENQWGNPEFKPSAERYVQGTGGFACWLSEQDQSVIDKFLIVDYDNVIDDTQNQISSIISHLSISPSQQQINDALDIVDSDLRRSYLDNWEDVEAGNLADSIYSALSSKDKGELQAIKVDIYDWMYRKQLEQARFVDTVYRTYRMVNPYLFRAIKNNDNNVREKLSYTANNFDFTKSQYYQESSETYVVSLPADIGDLTRNLINCQHPEYQGLMTIEQFYQLWMTAFGKQ